MTLTREQIEEAKDCIFLAMEFEVNAGIKARCEKAISNLSKALAHLARGAGGVEAERSLLDTDPFCPSCGHNRDKSCISTVDMGDGKKQCQMCGAGWSETDLSPVRAEVRYEIATVDGWPINSVIFKPAAQPGTHDKVPALSAPVQAEAVTFSGFCALAISTGLISADAVEDSDGYDGGLTFSRLQELYRAITPIAHPAPAQPGMVSVSVEQLQELLNGILNQQDNAGLRNDKYDVGYLGAMSDSVRAMLSALPSAQPAGGEEK